MYYLETLHCHTTYDCIYSTHFIGINVELWMSQIQQPATQDPTYLKKITLICNDN